ncbi:hypothetical protein ScPMuIL_015935 [Solemya velum]
MTYRNAPSVKKYHPSLQRNDPAGVASNSEWIRRGPGNWCSFRRLIRTNNDCEGWHRRFNCRAARENLPFYVLVELLEKEARLVNLGLQLVAEHSLTTTNKKSSKDRQETLTQLWTKYEEKNISTKDFFTASLDEKTMSLKPRHIDFDSTWSTLLETVRGVITYVYALCVAVDPLVDQLYQETKTFLEKYVQELHNKVIAAGEDHLLSSYHRYSEEYGKGAGYLNQLYRYLNTAFIKKKKHSEADINYGRFQLDSVDQMMEIGELALDIWKRLMVEPLQNVMLKLILRDIQSDREDMTVNQNVLHGVINSFVDVEQYRKKNQLLLYEEVFEIPFLRETGDYYRKEASQLKDECTCSEYMEKVIQKLDNENFRSRKFLHPSSYAKVTHECQQRMVADHLQFIHEFLKSDCKELMHTERRKDLGNMYTLLKPIQRGLGFLIQQVEDHIRQMGLEAVKNLKGENIPAQFVESMLNVHKRYTELIHIVFQGDQQFIGALDKACAVAINYRSTVKVPCKSPELLAKYCDNLLKKSSKGVAEAELDDMLSSCITVFKYLDDKDVYQRFYAKMLAKRLIYGQSASMDAEEAMINRLKQACGYEFTNKLHRMFTDVNISTDLSCKFSEFLKRDSINLGINFSIMVLQAGAWPIGQSNLPTFAIPQELERSVRMFELFYSQNFSGRKLTWMHTFCSAELKVNHLKRPYFVTMGTFHMTIILLFNSSDSHTFREILDHTQLPDSELSKQLQCLIDTKIIVTEGDVTESSTFRLNMEYTNKRTKFKITAAMAKETAQDIDQAHSAVDKDRKMYIEAAIVRTMKARKVLKHNLLIQEVISQARSRFTPSISMIKKCTEALIDKQYLERTPQTTDEYSYVA